jgi:lipopolysaccharide/colanic/teichoic acid biosynthesis glycosyltransferase
MASDRLARSIVERTAAAVLVLLSVPLIALTAAISVACYRAWPFFVQDRIGYGGRAFRFIKVRTLPPHTDRYADKYSIGESRIPAIMRTVRRLHLDELPQLLHVATGQMVFVGPRPEMPNLHARLPEPFATERTSVRPGVTGLWQISPHCRQLIGERTEYDRLYIGHRTPAFDGWILFRTTLKMFLGRTTHLFDVPDRVVRRVPVAPAITLVEPAVPVRTPVPAFAGAGSLAD